MKNIITPDFLLYNATGKRLFHSVAAALPIIDFHNHIDPFPLAQNKRYDNIYQLWVQHDPYKHRAMRIYGIPEELITGAGNSDYDKFLAWAECLVNTAGNPLFHWSCMELGQVFGIDQVLTKENAERIWDIANSLLAQDGYGALDILKRFNVEMLCTSDDLTDSLEHHITMRNTHRQVSCLPSLRADSILGFDWTWLEKLTGLTGIQPDNLDMYKKAIRKRLDFFDNAGCLLADHSLDSGFLYVATEEKEANRLFEQLLHRNTLTGEALARLQSHLLAFLGKEYALRQWKMQLHIGAYRYTNTTLRNRLGPAGGYATIGSTANVQGLCSFLDTLDVEGHLPKTILYTLNPADNAVFATLTGSYAQSHVKGKIQFGPAWWYNDHLEGITQQLTALCHYGLLSTAIGFTTDSRSILSFTRHEYYRRILCNLIGGWVEEGKLPDDSDFLDELVANVCCHNIKNWIKKHKYA